MSVVCLTSCCSASRRCFRGRCRSSLTVVTVATGQPRSRHRLGLRCLGTLPTCFICMKDVLRGKGLLEFFTRRCTGRWDLNVLPYRERWPSPGSLSEGPMSPQPHPKVKCVCILVSVDFTMNWIITSNLQTPADHRPQLSLRFFSPVAWLPVI